MQIEQRTRLLLVMQLAQLGIRSEPVGQEIDPADTRTITMTDSFQRELSMLFKVKFS